jgi:hypothetical protein
VRRAGALVDRTQLKNPSVKLNWQATKKDMVSFLYFDGFKIKDGPQPGVAGILFDAPTATYHQDNAYTDVPLHGLWKIADDRVITSNMFLSAKYAYYNTGFILDPIGGLDSRRAAASPWRSRSARSTRASTSGRRRSSTSTRTASSARWAPATTEVRLRLSQHGATSGTLWPGNMILALENSPTDLRAQVFRQGFGGNRADYSTSTSATRSRVTADAGSRRPLRPAGRQGAAGDDAVECGVPERGARLHLRRLRHAVHLEEHLAARRRHLRAGRIAPHGGAAQLQPLRGPARDRHGRRDQPDIDRGLGRPTAGWTRTTITSRRRVRCRRTQAGLHHLGRRLQPGGADRPVTSANFLDPDLKAPKTTSMVVGIDRELRPNLAVR